MIIYKQYFLIFNIFITVTYQICKVAPKHQKSLKKIAFEDIIWLPKFWDYICKFAYNLYYNTYEIRYWEPEKNRSRLADFVCKNNKISFKREKDFLTVSSLFNLTEFGTIQYTYLFIWYI